MRNKHIKALGIVFFIWFLLYLLGSFYSVSFNISTWNNFFRFFLTMLSILLLLFYPSIIQMIKNNDL